MSVVLDVRFRLTSGAIFSGRANDLSLSGIFVESDQRLAFGTKLEVILVLPGSAAPLQLPGVVRWSKAHGFGVQFGLLGARVTHELTCFLRNEQAMSAR